MTRSLAMFPSLIRSLVVTLALAVPAAAQAPDSLPDWVTIDADAKKVDLALEVTHPAGAASATLNGEHDGSIQLVVPLGWTVRWSWKNQDSTAKHSLVVVAEREKLPEQGGQPALTNAVSRAVTGGLPVGGKDETTFVGDAAGWYWMLCGVPTHALKGEWIGLKIDPKATSVSVRRKAS